MNSVVYERTNYGKGKREAQREWREEPKGVARVIPTGPDPV
jgi:hypothetical protein